MRKKLIKKRNQKKDAKQKVKKVIKKLLSQKGMMQDMAIHSKIVISLTREEMSVMYR